MEFNLGMWFVLLGFMFFGVWQLIAIEKVLKKILEELKKRGIG